MIGRQERRIDEALNITDGIIVEMRKTDNWFVKTLIARYDMKNNIFIKIE